MSTPRTIVLVAFDHLQLLDLAGPVEVFDAADRIVGGGIYETTIATPDGGRVRTTSGIEIGADRAMADVPDTFDTVMVVGGRGTRPLMADEPFLASLRDLAGRADRIASVCSGALVLAAAGLLDGYQATTHWGSCDLLAEVSGQVEVLPDQIYVHDRDRWTSAGVTAGIDLTLAMVEADHGPELAHEVAAWLVVFARRPGGQAQFSAQLQAQAARTPAIAGVQRWLPDHLADDLTVDRLAERAGMSPRNFARAFRAETGTTPAAHVEELRVEAARRLLETTDQTVASIARHVGIKHAETLHRAFGRRIGTTPDRYRQHFARTPA
ncbi:GlxA family transcriptional regulator [Aquihabitans sp. McL0605]|uniref:GlxA family transcriptional regulator n=1 Tax=Aquihabitans sp. McL0605 TaxID=3415671 RepID=UPI003CF0AA76